MVGLAKVAFNFCEDCSDRLPLEVKAAVEALRQELKQVTGKKVALVECLARGEIAADWTNILSNPSADLRFY